MRLFSETGLSDSQDQDESANDRECSSQNPCRYAKRCGPGASLGTPAARLLQIVARELAPGDSVELHYWETNRRKGL